MVIYFTGTGNSKYVAEKIAKELNDSIVDMFPYLKEERNGDFESDKPYVFVVPTYAWRIPRVVEDFIQKSNFKGTKKMYFVLTCGGSILGAGKYAKLLCEKIKSQYMGIFEIVMPENYIAMFNAPEEEAAKIIVKAARRSILKAARIIGKEEFYEDGTNFFGKAMSSIVNSCFYNFGIRDSKFKTDGNCTSCGLCEKLCPMNNIKLIDGKPKWNGKCTHCMACICYCPTEAIEYGKGSVRRNRYTVDKAIKK